MTWMFGAGRWITLPGASADRRLKPVGFDQCAHVHRIASREIVERIAALNLDGASAWVVIREACARPRPLPCSRVQHCGSRRWQTCRRTRRGRQRAGQGAGFIPVVAIGRGWTTAGGTGCVSEHLRDWRPDCSPRTSLGPPPGSRSRRGSRGGFEAHADRPAAADRNSHVRGASVIAAGSPPGISSTSALIMLYRKLKPA